MLLFLAASRSKNYRNTFFINIKTNYVQLTLTQFKARSFTSCVKAERFPFITNHR